MSRTLLSRVLLNMLSFGDVLPGLEGVRPDLAIEKFSLAEPQAKLDLAFTIAERPDALLCHLMGAAGLFEQASLTHIKEDLRLLLEQIQADPEIRIDRLLPETRHQSAALCRGTRAET